MTCFDKASNNVLLCNLSSWINNTVILEIVVYCMCCVQTVHKILSIDYMNATKSIDIKYVIRSTISVASTNEVFICM